MITELSMTNFKSWKKIEKMRLAPLTGLFGTNSSGKTSILQLLLMLKQTMESSDRAQVLEFGDEKSLANLGSFRDVVYGHTKPGNIDFSLRWDLPEELVIKDPDKKSGKLFSATQLAFMCEVGENGSDRLAVQELAYELGNQLFQLKRKAPNSTDYDLGNNEGGYRFTRTAGRPWGLPAPIKFYGFPDQVYSYYQNAGFLADLQLSFEQLFNQVYYLGPLREFPQRHYMWSGSEPVDMGRRGARVVDALLAANQRGHVISRGQGKRRQTLEQCVAQWLKKLGLIHDFKIEPIAENSNIYQVKVQKTSSSAQVVITDVGFGVSQILPVLALCYYVPEGSILILEQPEIHLHPSVQSGLADVLIDAMKYRNIQIILESHSEHLLRRLQRRVADETIDRDQTALYFCEASDKGSQMKQLELDLFGNIQNWPKGFFGDEFTEIAEMAKASMMRKRGIQQ
ncbi:MAG: DUF3696 domain-containing protein [Armatimonadota bacterium]